MNAPAHLLISKALCHDTAERSSPLPHTPHTTPLYQKQNTQVQTRPYVLNRTQKENYTMSELRELLTSRQLLKHHALLALLTHNPNVKYTLAQLDYLLPDGASIQRFPEEWIDLLREGHCGNRNIEVIFPAEDDDDDDNDNDEEKRLARARIAAVNAVTVGQTSLDHGIALICRRPVIVTLAELASLIESPATVPDVEGCAALQTSQVELPDAVLREVQRRGIAYYFSEAMQATAAAGLARQGQVSSSGGGGGAAAEQTEQLLSTASSGSGGVLSAVVALPPGVRLRYILLTQRGITARDEHCLPVRLRVGERLQVTLDDENAIAALSRSGAGVALAYRQRLDVSWEQTTSVIRDKQSLLENPPLRVAAKPSAAMPSGAGGSGSGSDGPAVPFTKIQITVEAVRSVGRFRLMLRTLSRHRADGGEAAPAAATVVDCPLEFEVVDVETTLPGSLVGRERTPSSFVLPPAYLLADPAVCGGGTADPAAEDASSRAARVLPWWQSSSPTCSLVRDATAPTEESIRAAAALVFTRRAVSHESKLRAAKKQMKELQAQQAAASGRDKLAKHRARRDQQLRNRHLIHFGLDASVPFVVRKK